MRILIVLFISLGLAVSGLYATEIEESKDLVIANKIVGEAYDSKMRKKLLSDRTIRLACSNDAGLNGCYKKCTAFFNNCAYSEKACRSNLESCNRICRQNWC